MARRMLGDAWAEYREKLIPPEAGAVQVEETRRAFYAGAIQVFHGIHNGLSGGDDIGPEDEELIRGIATELDEYVASLVALAEAEGGIH